MRLRPPRRAYRAPAATGDWEGIAVTEWRPIGPALAALLVWVRFRMRLSVRLCRAFALELFGLALSDGALQQAIHESG